VNYQIENLLHRIESWHKTPSKVAPEATACAARHLPTPQVTWTLLGLIHYRLRKTWAWKVFKQHLRSHVKPQPARVTIHEVIEGTAEGIISGMPEWSYHLDGNNSFIGNRATREVIHPQRPRCHRHLRFPQLLHQNPTARPGREAAPGVVPRWRRTGGGHGLPE
jgi:hypothetical protein